MVADVDLGVEIGAASSSSDADASSSRRWLHKNKRTRSARAGEARSRIEQAEAGARKANRILLADVDGYASKFRRAFSRAFLSFVCSLCYTIALFVQGAENRAVVGSGGRGVCRFAYHSRAEGEGTACSAAGS